MCVRMGKGSPSALAVVPEDGDGLNRRPCHQFRIAALIGLNDGSAMRLGKRRESSIVTSGLNDHFMIAISGHGRGACH